MSERLPFPATELRHRTVRGVLVTGGFLVLIDGVVLLQGLIVTRLLGPRQIGLYGIVSTTVISLMAFRRIGIDEAFVQQEEAGQQEEFQNAFTLELGLAALMALLIAALAPLVALVYHDATLLPLMLSLMYLPLALALQAPLWIFFRRMDYRRQRSLQALQPVIAFVVTVPLAAFTALGVWSLVVGQFTGYIVAVAAAVAVSPYPLALRFDRQVASRYVRFSGPILVTVIAAMLIAQGQILGIKLHDGLAAAGFITLAVTVTRYIDRADHIVTATIYPAICAIREKRDQLEELYLKSNRATLVWVLPYSVGIVLFAPDLVHLLLGPRWQPAVVLLQGLAMVAAITQLGFNWFSFYRARGETRPQAVEAAAGAVAFLVFGLSGLLLDGFDGFIAGRIIAALIALAVRGVYIRRLLPGARFRTLLAPTLPSVALAAGAALALRLALWGGHRGVAQAVGEIAVFGAVYAASTVRRERPLLAELGDALRSRPSAVAIEGEGDGLGVTGIPAP